MTPPVEKERAAFWDWWKTVGYQKHLEEADSDDIAWEAWQASRTQLSEGEQSEWTTEPPSVEGWYWRREVYTQVPDVGPQTPVRVVERDGRMIELFGGGTGYGTLNGPRDDYQWWPIPIELPGSQYSARLREENRQLREAWDSVRDMLLYERGPLAEAGLEGEQVNAVLSVFDDGFSELPPVQPSSHFSPERQITVRDAFRLAGFPVTRESVIWVTLRDEKWVWMYTEELGHCCELEFYDEPHPLANTVGWHRDGDFKTVFNPPDLSSLPASRALDALPELIRNALSKTPLEEKC